MCGNAKPKTTPVAKTTTAPTTPKMTPTSRIHFNEPIRPEIVGTTISDLPNGSMFTARTSRKGEVGLFFRLYDGSRTVILNHGSHKIGGFWSRRGPTFYDVTVLQNPVIS